MKKIFFVLAFLISLLNGFSQSIVPLRGDSIVMSKTGGNAELVLLNSTRDSLHGLLTNTGLGRTKFIRTKTINDSTIIIGLDTFILRGGVGHSGNVGTVTSVAAAGLVPLFTSVVNTATSTPSIVYTLSSAPANSVYGRNGASAGAPNFYTPLLASSVFSNQGTTTTVLHGNAAGDPSWGAVNLATDVTGLLPNANLANSTLGFTVPGITGLAPNWAASSVALGNNVVLNIPYAGSAGVTMGLVSKVDYDAWYAGAAGFPNIPANRILGRLLSGTGPASALTGTEATTILSLFTSTDHGVVPASGGCVGCYVDGDAVWKPLPVGGSGTVNTGTINTLAYYAVGGTSVSSLAAITPNMAVISNANGLPTHSTTTATQISYLNTTTSNVQTQINNLNLGWFIVKAYGAIGDGVANDQAAIQAAIDAAEVAGGYVVFPSGNYKINSQLTITERDVKLIGIGDVVITSTFATGDILYVSPTGTPANDGTQNHGIQGLEIKNLDFQTTVARTSGAAIHVRYSEHAIIQNVRIGAMKSTDYLTSFTYDHFDGIFMEYQGACNISQVQIYPHHTGIKISGDVPAGGWPYFNYDGHLHGNWQIWGDKSVGSVGIHIGGGVGGFKIELGNQVLAETGVLIDKTLTATTNRELFFGHFFVDSNEGYGYNIADTSVNAVKWDNSWIAGFGRGTQGLTGFPYGAAINVAKQPSTTKFFVDGVQIYSGYGGGIQASGGQWTITSSLIYDVGEGTNGGDAISMLHTNHTNIVITGNNIHNIGNATKGMGIRLDAATTLISVVGNNIFDMGEDEYSGPADNNGTVKVRGNTNIPDPAGSGSPAGSTTQIQYNTAGAFDASSALTFDFSTGSLGVTKSQNAGSLAVISNTNAGNAAFAGFQLISDGGSSYMYRTSIAYGTTIVADATTIQDAGGGDIVMVGAAEVARFKNGGNIVVPASSYINWGTTSGTTGYGFRDNAGTMEFKNSGGSWATLGGGGSPGGSNTHVQYNSSGAFAGNSGFVYNGVNAVTIGTTTSGGFLVLNSNLNAAAGIVHVASGTNMLSFDFSNRAEFGGTVDLSSGRQVIINDYETGARRLGMNASGDLFVGESNTVYGLKVTQAGVATLGADDAYDATTWNGNLSIPTKNAIRDKIESLVSGVTTMAAIGSSPNANGASISGVTLTLQPASTSFGGVVTTGSQSFIGFKTFTGVLASTISSATAGNINVLLLSRIGGYTPAINDGAGIDFALDHAGGNGSHGGIRVISTDVTSSFAAKMEFLVATGGNPGTSKMALHGNGNLILQTGQLNIATQYTPSSSTDTNFPEKTITIDDTFLYYRTSGGTWKKIAWTTF